MSPFHTLPSTSNHPSPAPAARRALTSVIPLATPAVSKPPPTLALGKPVSMSIMPGGFSDGIGWTWAQGSILRKRSPEEAQMKRKRCPTGPGPGIPARSRAVSGSQHPRPPRGLPGRPGPLPCRLHGWSPGWPSGPSCQSPLSRHREFRRNAPSHSHVSSLPLPLYWKALSAIALRLFFFFFFFSSFFFFFFFFLRSYRGQPGWLSGLAPPAAQGVILETRDRVPCGAPCMEPASLCLFLSLSVMNKYIFKIFFFKKEFI
ncbi:unnamed protein product [Nyctereutes procyonoides]|uniref:(raccoon dog) hypothetical protein n=1 Tax=Nyctereutes procyonoides TaxID=34880 RepID=A0A811ZRH0_NYCPR|nr:unnamed protein product [Nyctereutes procyonoides]